MGRSIASSPTATSIFYALDAKTGEVISSFGKGGRVDLSAGLDPRARGWRWNGAPLIVRDVAVIGSAMTDQDFATRMEGRRIRAVVQVTKQAFAYVFDRVTGNPVWPIEARPVPPSTVPGERASSTSSIRPVIPTASSGARPSIWIGRNCFHEGPYDRSA
jgi:glucose dehydrogenase